MILPADRVPPRTDLYAVQREVRELLEQRYIKAPCSRVLVVVPEQATQRQPYILIQISWSDWSTFEQAELEDHIETSWSDADFEFVWLGDDEEGL